MKITDALLAEHAVFHNLFDHIEATLPKLTSLGEIHVLARLLDAVLQAHSKVEDELLIEPLQHCFAQIGQQETFHDEHDEIEAHLKATLQCRTLRTARRLLQTAVVSSRMHFDKEERLVFPIAEKALKSHTLTSLADAWKRRRRD